ARGGRPARRVGAHRLRRLGIRPRLAPRPPRRPGLSAAPPAAPEAPMSAATPDRVQQLFNQAQPLAPPERAALPDRACPGDPALRGEVERVLHFHGKAVTEQFLAGDAVDEPPPDDLIGRQVGPYRVLEVLGRGGMGRVYRAERVADFRQEVALKVV